jgi:hypothetical protein
MTSIEELIELVKNDYSEMVAVFKDVARIGLDAEPGEADIRKFLIFDGHRFEIMIFGKYWTAFIDGQELTYTTEPL